MKTQYNRDIEIRVLLDAHSFPMHIPSVLPCRRRPEGPRYASSSMRNRHPLVQWWRRNAYFISRVRLLMRICIPDCLIRWPSSRANAARKSVSFLRIVFSSLTLSPRFYSRLYLALYLPPFILASEQRRRDKRNSNHWYARTCIIRHNNRHVT